MLPKIMSVRQDFPDDALPDCGAAVYAELDRISAASRLEPDRKVVIAVGSRGIDRHVEIVRAVAEYIRRSGASPLIVPAMGSHAGGTADSQCRILLEQGIGVRGFPATVKSSVNTVVLGKTDLGTEIRFDAIAAEADVLFVVNRVKPHTDFTASVESGISKMLMVGLGKPLGARNAHVSFRKFGFLPALRAAVGLILGRIPTVIGIAIVENERHRCIKVEAIPGEILLARESVLLELARNRMGRLPIEELDLLIVEEIGKNISGSGMDTNVISRKSNPSGSVDGDMPRIGYIYIRSLSPESRGNAVGIGLADFCNEKVLKDIDPDITYLNCITSGTPRGAAIPIHLRSDAAVFEAVLNSSPVESPRDLRIAWIKNTLSLESFFVSEPVLREPGLEEKLRVCPQKYRFKFDRDGNIGNPFAE